MKSAWMEAGVANGQLHQSLSGVLEVDTVIVGGGITGISTALAISDSGRSVAVLEAGKVGASNTGLSTGNLYAVVSGGLGALAEKWGMDVVREVVAMRSQALDRIEQTVDRFSIDCEFARQPLCACIAADEHKVARLEQDYAVAQQVGLAPQWVSSAEKLAVPVLRAMRIEGQAQFNPYQYTRALASALAERGVRIHEHSAVREVDADDGVVRTSDGEVRARHIVFATHTPIGFNLVQAQMEVFREYAVSAPLPHGTCPDGIFWVHDAQRSVRCFRADGHNHLIVVGEKHKAGASAPGTDYHERLRLYASKHFPVIQFHHTWSAQQYQSADALPYIGVSGHDNVYIATGFGADGLTWGAVAASVIGDLIAGNPNDSCKLLSPRRLTPVKSAKAWLAASSTAVKHIVGQRLVSSALHTVDDVPRGEGRIVDIDGSKRAVYRSVDGDLSILSATCPHLKCIVSWNALASTWDCPCHGSRFRTDGSVVEGPSLRPLDAQRSGD